VAANAGAFASKEDFGSNDVVTHAHALSGLAVRVAGGLSDPFHPGVAALVSVLPPGSEIDVSTGCHDGAFFESQEGPSLDFLGRHLTG
jgi:hypothetical protein